jgi:Ubiquitin-2 like Rad60 SUMO-like
LGEIIKKKAHNFSLDDLQVASKLDTSLLAEAEEMLEIKVQMVERRADKVTVRLRPMEPMAKVYCAVAESMDVPDDTIRLHFDGFLVDRAQTAEDLDLEGGEVFDCVLASTE